MTDAYTKLVLTIIAGALSILAYEASLPTASAQFFTERPSGPTERRPCGTDEYNACWVRFREPIQLDEPIAVYDALRLQTP